GYKLGDFPHAEELCQQILSLPMYPGLSNSQIHQVVDVLEELTQTPALLTFQTPSSLVPG
ncbi:MAG: DegT/DnrJ/EryC1/StrS aminotransferase family protein, partial [Leptolyngbyaceae cyanobacterium SL_5_14]|nr:DegT/DnrJ/EryC1/StrS aminotransferase family protein [Leptolyngbyaceae cyanobacterium SL_5_14]